MRIEDGVIGVVLRLLGIFARTLALNAHGDNMSALPAKVTNV